MLAVRSLILILFLLLSSSQLTNSLLCYFCATCDEPFIPEKVQIMNVSESDGYSCAKYWAANTKIIRNPLKSCTPNAINLEGTGIFCCNTDLCNDATKMIPVKSIILSLGLVIIVMFF